MQSDVLRIAAPRPQLFSYFLTSGTAVALRTCLAVVAGGAFAELAASALTIRTVVLLSCMLVATPVLQAASSWLGARMMTTMAVELRARMASAITRKPYAFFVHAGQGPLQSRLLFDVQEVLMAYLQVRSIIVQTLTTAGVVAALSAFAVFNPLLGMPLAVAILCCAVLIRLWTTEIRRRSAEFSDAYGELVESVTVLTSRSAALDTIVFNGERGVRERFRQVLLRHQRINLRRVRAGILASLSIEAVGALTVLSTLALGVLMKNAGAIGVGEVAAGTFLAVTVMTPVSTLSQQLMESSGARSNQVRLASLERDSGERGRPVVASSLLAAGRLVLSLEEVGYTYEWAMDEVPPDLSRSGTKPGVPRDSALQGVSLSISRTERVGLTGESGSGKSTLGLLASGVIGGYTGSIRHYGRRVVFLGSEVSPFVGDLASYLAPEGQVDEQAMWAALEDVKLSSVFRERGIGLSSSINPAQGLLSVGQLRRLAVARGLVAAPDLVILDETLSNLEPVLVLSILDAIRRRGSATLLITHDRRHLAMCDRVVGLDRGRINTYVSA